MNSVAFNSFLVGALLLVGTSSLLADTTETEVAIDKVTARLRELQVRDQNFKGKTSDGEKITAQRIMALRERAAGYEAQRRWSEAYVDYASAQSMASKLVSSSAMLDGEAQLWLCMMRMAYQMRDWGKAKAALVDLKTAHGWPSEAAKPGTYAEIIKTELALEEFDQALADTGVLRSVITSARVGKSAELYKEEEWRSYAFEAAANFFKGDLLNARATWQMAQKLDRSVPFQAFPEEQVALNADLAAHPDSELLRIKRARLFIDYKTRGLGGIYSVIESTPIDSGSFYLAGLYDINKAFDTARKNNKTPSAQLYAERAYAAASYNLMASQKNLPPMPEAEIQSDLNAAINSSPTTAAALETLGDYYQTVSYGYKAGTPESRAVFANGVNNYSMAIYYGPKNNAELTRKRDLMLVYFFMGEAKPPAAQVEPTTALDWKVRGNELNAAGFLKAARSAYENALDIDPKFADARNNLAGVYKQACAWDLALDEANQAIVLDPKHLIAYYMRAQIYSVLMEYKSALSDANNAVDFALTPEVKRDALLLRSDIYESLRKEELALADLKLADQIKPLSPGEWYVCGTLEFEIADVKAAQISFTKAIAGNPKSGFNQLMLAVMMNLQNPKGTTELSPAVKAQINKTKPILLSSERQRAGRYFEREYKVNSLFQDSKGQGAKARVQKVLGALALGGAKN